MLKYELFEFNYGEKNWFFTSSKKPIIYLDNEYLPLVLGRSDIENEDLDKCTVDVKFPFPKVIANGADDLQAFLLSRIYFNGLTCTITELCGADVLVLFRGRVTIPKFSSSEHLMTLTCSTAESYQRRNILTRKFQRPCPNKVYDRFCGLPIASWSVQAQVLAVAGKRIAFTIASNPNGLAIADGFFDRGILIANGVGTTIASHIGSNLSLYRPHFNLAEDDIVTIAAGCNQSFSMCRDKFQNNARHMGFPFILDVNPINDFIIK